MPSVSSQATLDKAVRLVCLVWLQVRDGCTDCGDNWCVKHAALWHHACGAHHQHWQQVREGAQAAQQGIVAVKH